MKSRRPLPRASAAGQPAEARRGLSELRGRAAPWGGSSRSTLGGPRREGSGLLPFLLFLFLPFFLFLLFLFLLFLFLPTSFFLLFPFFLFLFFSPFFLFLFFLFSFSFFPSPPPERKPHVTAANENPGSMSLTGRALSWTVTVCLSGRELCPACSPRGSLRRGARSLRGAGAGRRGGSEVVLLCRPRQKGRGRGVVQTGKGVISAVRCQIKCHASPSSIQ